MELPNEIISNILSVASEPYYCLAILLVNKRTMKNMNMILRGAFGTHYQIHHVSGTLIIDFAFNIYGLRYHIYDTLKYDKRNFKRYFRKHNECAIIAIKETELAIVATMQLLQSRKIIHVASRDGVLITKIRCAHLYTWENVCMTLCGTIIYGRCVCNGCIRARQSQ